MLRRKGQQAEVTLSVHVGTNVLLKLWDAVLEEGGMSGARGSLLSGIAEPNTCHGLCCMAGTVPVDTSFSLWLFPTAGDARLLSPKCMRISYIARRPVKSPGNCSP